MDDATLTALRFPIGPMPRALPDAAAVARGIDAIAALPARLRAAVEPLDEARLATAYRPGGWTVRQVVHHLADSHVNSWCRFRLALTEDEPTIRPYHEDRWATLADADAAPVAISLDLLEALHARWAILLRSLSPSDLARTFRHPELGDTIRLDTNVAIYAWHGEHHLAHVTELARRSGWSRADRS